MGIIHVAANSNIKTVSDLEDTKVAILSSRIWFSINGLHADNHGWKTDT
jgi:TRAP-type uncharacterized transport system substrate-binding protein